MRVFLSSNPDNLAAENPDVTVEAEFGARVVEGRFLTMAHHGPRSGQPCPCSYENIGMVESTTIGISHVDLDTVGGVMAVMGTKPDADEFWNLAAFVDVNGEHKMAEFGASAETVRAIRAYWAFKESNQVRSPEDGAVEDVTAKVDVHAFVLTEILAGCPLRLTFGDVWHGKREILKRESLVTYSGGVIMRKAPGFVNHLYDIDGVQQIAIVAVNTTFQSVTVSFSREGFDACKLVQKLWGDKAGGHKGIAGSPRDQVMTAKDADNAFQAVRDLVSMSWAQQMNPGLIIR